ncbi:hypothetical protein [Burkholderia cenocepacia]|uniref:hypothetical protein n=1 Tax=Burkholderia cenocepacia TaxID=95486 RepID=UPI0019058E69|nr:hypothetical protein [Burkholderia cenocepacia]MBJ9696814.1 hypothetical protein [Burkholderia cenocepacia]
MRRLVMRQRDLFEESVQDALVPEEMQTELVTQLALLMYGLINAIEREVQDEQDQH